MAFLDLVFFKITSPIMNLKKKIENIFIKKKLTEDSISPTEISILKRHGFQSINNLNDNDVFLIGYPKSGNTLLQHIIAHLVYGLRSDSSIGLINASVTEYYSNPYFFRLDKRHFFKCHELPSSKFRNVIYIVRDGRDAVLSHYFMLLNKSKEVDLEEMYKLGGDSFVGSWNNHVVQWKENSFKSRILYLSYEDLLSKQKKRKTILDIASFLQIERSSEEIEQVVNSTSLENMKKLEKSFAWKHKKHIQGWKRDTNFIRKGKKGSFKNIDKNLIKSFEKISHQGLKTYGYI